VLDALNGTLYYDDSQVVEISASKVYESLHGTTKEGTYISIRPVPLAVVQAAALSCSSSSVEALADYKSTTLPKLPSCDEME
jgi:hypothetical protein